MYGAWLINGCGMLTKHAQVTADQQDEISLWKLQLIVVEAAIHCKTYTRTGKKYGKPSMN